MTASGDVSDYDDAKQDELVAAFATTVAVPESSVSLTVTPASVKLLFTITVADTSEAAGVASQVEASLPNAAEASSALAMGIETTPVIAVLAPPTPPMPALPYTTPQVIANDTDDSVESEADDALTISLGGEWYVVAGGLFATALVLAFGAYSRAKAKLRFTGILSIFIASGDAFTDIAFTAQQLHKMQSLKEHCLAFLLVLFLVVPTAFSAYQVIQALRLPLLDTEKLQDLSAYYACVLLIALTNMEVLRVLPWREGTANFDGLPDQALMVRVWLAVMFLEDLPQFCLQLILALDSDTGLLAPLSLTFTVTAMAWRALRKAIYLVPVTSSSQTVLSVNAARANAEVGSTVNSTQLPLTSTWSWSKRARTRFDRCRGGQATSTAPRVEVESAAQAGDGQEPPVYHSVPWQEPPVHDAQAAPVVTVSPEDVALSDSGQTQGDQARRPTTGNHEPSHSQAQSPLSPVRGNHSVSAAFELIDSSGTGMLNRAKVIKAMRTDPMVRQLIDLPPVTQDDGSRDHLEQVFQAMDRNDSKDVDFAEFARAVAELRRASREPVTSKDSGSTDSPIGRARAWKASATQGLPAPAELAELPLETSEVSEGLGT